MLSDNGINVPLTLSLSCLPTFLSIVQRHFSYGGGGVLRNPLLFSLLSDTEPIFKPEYIGQAFFRFWCKGAPDETKQADMEAWSEGMFLSADGFLVTLEAGK